MVSSDRAPTRPLAIRLDRYLQPRIHRLGFGSYAGPTYARRALVCSGLPAVIVTFGLGLALVALRVEDRQVDSPVEEVVPWLR
jgi:hypothetical protein